MGIVDFATSVPSVAGEFATAELGDVRLHARLASVASRLSAAPALGFPQALKTEAETEGFYRLVGNSRVTYGRLVKAHVEQTVGRMVPGATVRVLHDTSEFSFSGEPGSRQGLGHARSKSSAQGFFGHASFAVTATDVPRPLGAVGLVCWARTQRREKARPGRRLSGWHLARMAEKESARWGQQVEAAEAAVGNRSSLVHIMDREADAYPLLCNMAAKDRRFVVRMSRDRVVYGVDSDGGLVEDGGVRLSEALTSLRLSCTREVALARRAGSKIPGSRRTHPPRTGRSATLAISAGRLALRRPNYFGEELPDALEVHVVYVHEVNTPSGCDPVSWVLVTNEPIGTPAQVEAVVDHYRGRWIIEEFFKALKTGCAFESRQLESFATLTNALALFVPIAWQMLLLRSLTRTSPNAPASDALTPVQIQVLRHFQRAKMPAANATVRDALYAVAGLGGHLKNNGFPGWLTLTRGMQELVALEAAWSAGAASAAETNRNP